MLRSSTKLFSDPLQGRFLSESTVEDSRYMLRFLRYPYQVESRVHTYRKLRNDNPTKERFVTQGIVEFISVDESEPPRKRSDPSTKFGHATPEGGRSPRPRGRVMLPESGFELRKKRSFEQMLFLSLSYSLNCCANWHQRGIASQREKWLFASKRFPEHSLPLKEITYRYIV